MASIGPTQAGFLEFIRQVMGISTQNLPDNSPVIGFAYDVAVELVNQQIQVASPLMYQMAVYNLGGSNIIEFAPDQDGSTYFADLRKQFNMLMFVSGVIQSSNDESTGNSMVVPKAFENLTIADLQYLKNPYGRQYLSIAQRYGALWGLT